MGVLKETPPVAVDATVMMEEVAPEIVLGLDLVTEGLGRR
jgi:hypothetical protein